MLVDGVIYNAKLATFDPLNTAAYGMAENAALVWDNGRIIDLGPHIDTHAVRAKSKIDAGGQLLTPGFIDCHTHLVFGGDRAGEFEQRLQGHTYEEIARAGGGIMNTVRATRAASEEDLVSQALPRLQRLQQSGVTCVEIKSGYGLSYSEEIKHLRAIQELKRHSPVNIHATCLAAHVVPHDFSGSADDYMATVCNELLPEVAKHQLASAVDIFCESIAFTADHARRLFSRAKDFGLAVKGHVEQLSQSRGVEVICEFAGLSADHIEYADAAQVKAMKEAGVVAVLLPGAFHYLRETQLPPVAAMRGQKLPMAVATDLNPGSSPMYSITLAAHLACLLFTLTPEESLSGISYNAACALGVAESKGCLRKGHDADFVLWPVAHPRQLVYEAPSVMPSSMWIGGRCCDDITA